MQGQLNCEFKFATFSCRRRRQHQQDAQEKEFSDLLEQALQPAVVLVRARAHTHTHTQRRGQVSTHSHVGTHTHTHTVVVSGISSCAIHTQRHSYTYTHSTTPGANSLARDRSETAKNVERGKSNHVTCFPSHRRSSPRRGWTCSSRCCRTTAVVRTLVLEKFDVNDCCTKEKQTRAFKTRKLTQFRVRETSVAVSEFMC